ncbi:MAG: alpha/beta hydrolase-fold protein [Bacteroidota bacterium]
MKKLVLTFCAALFPLLIIAQTNKNAIIPEPANVEIKGTQVQKIFSSVMNQEYELHIHLPRYYDDESRKFPVLYVIDSQWDFALVNSIYGSQYYDGFLPEIVIVGVTWAGKDVNVNKLRTRDFTPTIQPRFGETGRASDFLKFFRNELIPFIESNFRVTSDRGLVGSSFGGLFTLYAMLTETDLFNKYLLTSPSLHWDNELLFKLESEYSKKQTDLNASLYMAMGSYEDVTLFNKMINVLESRNYKGFRFAHKIIDGAGHSGNKAEGFTRGMQFVYERPIVIVSPDILKKYTGVYEIQPGVTARIILEDNCLYALPPYNVKIKLYPTSETEFYVKGEYSYGKFLIDDKGNVTELKLKQFSNEMTLKKIN